MLTDIEIGDIARKTSEKYMTQPAIINEAIRAALALDAQQREPEKPARKPWPKLPVAAEKEEDFDSLWRLIDARDQEICESCGKTDADAIALALSWTPRAAALLRESQALHPYTPPGPIDPSRHTRMYAQRDVLLAELASWDMPEPAHTK